MPVALHFWVFLAEILIEKGCYNKIYVNMYKRHVF